LTTVFTTVISDYRSSAVPSVHNRTGTMASLVQREACNDDNICGC
jgi:hypothetical protein